MQIAIHYIKQLQKLQTVNIYNSNLLPDINADADGQNCSI